MARAATTLNSAGAPTARRNAFFTPKLRMPSALGGDGRAIMTRWDVRCRLPRRQGLVTCQETEITAKAVEAVQSLELRDCPGLGGAIQVRAQGTSGTGDEGPGEDRLEHPRENADGSNSRPSGSASCRCLRSRAKTIRSATPHQAGALPACEGGIAPIDDAERLLVVCLRAWETCDY